VLRDDDAEDVVQQTFLQAFVNLVDFRCAANLRTWLTRIALNDALQRQRRQRSMVELDQLDTAQERVQSDLVLSSLTSPTPEQAAARNQVRDVNNSALHEICVRNFI
jgi:RNA polymerase sigma-70 factor (ECF subfamily)